MPHPQFSPDGKSIAFINNRNRLKKVLLGGRRLTIADSVNYSFSWGDSDVVVFARFRPATFDGSLLRTSRRRADRALPCRIAVARKEYSWPFLLPDAKAALSASGRLSKA